MDSMLQSLEERYEPLLRAAEQSQFSGASLILASAWADEQIGVQNAFAAAKIWLTASERFSPAWIETITSLCAELGDSRA